jgi:hypothetical protein
MCKFDFKWLRVRRRLAAFSARRRKTAPHDRVVTDADLIFSSSLLLAAATKIGSRISVVALAPLSCSGAGEFVIIF